jgi:hypothetical protein
MAAIGAPILLYASALAFASITYQSSQTAASSQVTTTSLTVSKPSGVASGDFMLASVAVHGGSSAVVTTVPSGWTLIGSTTNDANLLLLSYWKIAGGSEPGSYEWVISGSLTAEGGITRYTGVDTSNPIDAFAENSGLSITATTSVITTTVASGTVVALFAVDEGKSSVAGSYFSTPTGMTERYDVSNTAVAALGPSIALDDAFQISSGTVASKSSSIGGNNKAKNWATQIIALREPAGTIALDNSSLITLDNNGAYSGSFTTSGSNRLLTVCIRHNDGSSGFGGTISYAGTSLTRAATKGFNTLSSPANWVDLYYLINPASGSNQLVISGTAANAGGTFPFVSYNGVNQTSFPDALVTGGVDDGVTSWTTTITPIAGNAWAVICAGSQRDLYAGTGVTQRVIGSGPFFGDSNGPISGTYGMTLYHINGETNGGGSIVASFAPVAP